MRSLLMFALSLTCSPASSADWQPIGPWGGVDIELRAPDPGGQRVYAVTPAGLFRSDNRGTDWRLLPMPELRRQPPSAAQLGLTAADPDCVVAVFDHRYAYLSVDAGTTWQRLLESEPGLSQLGAEQAFTAVAVDPSDPQTFSIFLGTPRFNTTQNHFYREVYWLRTSDGGANFNGRWLAADWWQSECNLMGFLSVGSAKYDPDQPGQLFFDLTYLCPPLIGYQLFSVQNDELRLLAVTHVEADSYDQLPKSTIRSFGEALYWRTSALLYRVDKAEGGSSRVLNHVADMSPASGGELYVATATAVQRSGDGGASWLPVTGSGFGLGGITALHGKSVYVFADGRLLASNRESVFALPAGANAWHESAHGLSALHISTLSTDGSDDRIWAGLPNTLRQFEESVPNARVLYRSDDGGNQWHHAVDLDRHALWLHQILPDPRRPDVVYAVGSGCGNSLFGCVPGMQPARGLYRSSDGGSRWQAIGTGLGEWLWPGLRSIAVSGRASGVGPRRFFVGQRAIQPQWPLIFSAQNPETSWAGAAVGLPTASQVPYNGYLDVRHLAASGSNENRVYAGTTALVTGSSATPTIASGVFRSVDGGLSWQHASSGLPRFAENHSHQDIMSLVIDPSDDQRLWAIAGAWNRDRGDYDSYVYRTSNGGDSWHEAGNGLPEGDYRTLVADPRRPGHLYVGGRTGMFRSVDGGDHWTPMPTPTPQPVRTLAIGNNHLYAGSALGVHRLRITAAPGGPSHSCLLVRGDESPVGRMRVRCSR